MLYQDLNYILSDLAGVPESAINKYTDIDTLGIDEEGYESLMDSLSQEMDEPDLDYIKCLQSVGDLLDYINGE